MTATQIALGLVAIGSIASLAGALREERPARRTVALVTLGVVALTWLRVALTAPSFLHANLHGPALLEAIAAFPEEPTHRASYGSASFLILGALSAPFGHRLEAIAVVNQAFSVLASVFASLWVARVLGRPRIALLAMAAAALFVPLCRVGASEDAHNVATCFGAASLLAADVAGTRRSALALTAWVGLTIVMLHARQTLYPWAILGAAHLFAAGGGRAWSWRPALAGAGVVALTLAGRLVATLGDASERISVGAIPVLLTEPAVLWDLLASHPVLDGARFALVHLPLLAAGLYAVARAGRRGVSVVAAFALTFAVTLPFGFPGPGVELAFRTPLTVLAVALAGAGADALARAAGSARGAAVAALLGLAVATAPLALSGRRLLAWQSADWLEHQAVRRIAPSLPRRLRVVHVSPAEPAPAYHLPMRALREAGIDAKRAHPDPAPSRDTTFVFLVGIQCRGRSMLEDAGLSHPRDVDAAAFARLFRDMRSPPGAPPPLRPECEAAIAAGTPLGDSDTVRDPPDDLPFVRYGGQPIPIQFVRVDPARLGELARD